ncbi:hypothetical protein Pmani_026904 [Petrolisthes manimaculis]|uniref:Ig-like domain-containing protein n=1 Tax=Petrolisthes manimaculis TaxID=1843537 RepID=A0AAE1P394_9EUCA|nr:hypothetical protein Pmani_026904 [Petrolisthes manimaculis]
MVAWIYKGTGGRTVLTVATQVITKNPRISATQEAQAWVLTVTSLTKKDQGVYMCQVNTKPVRKQLGFLRVVVPPTIDDNKSSSDVTVNEGSDVELECVARGDPPPVIRWVREGGRRITFNASSAEEHLGWKLNLNSVGRNSSGAYLCIASNGVPPSVSKRILVNVNFSPQMVYESGSGRVGVAMEGVESLTCSFHARPLSSVRWYHGPRELSPHDTSLTITTSNQNEFLLIHLFLLLLHSFFLFNPFFSSSSFSYPTSSFPLSFLLHYHPFFFFFFFPLPDDPEPSPSRPVR